MRKKAIIPLSIITTLLISGCALSRAFESETEKPSDTIITEDITEIEESDLTSEEESEIISEKESEVESEQEIPSESEKESEKASEKEPEKESELESEAESETISEESESESEQHKQVAIPNGTENDANNNRNKWYYWNDQGWEGTNVNVTSAYLQDDEEVHISYEFIKIEKTCKFSVQLFYKNSSLKSGKDYHLEFSLYSKHGGIIIINHTEGFVIEAGWNELSYEYEEDGFQSSLQLGFSSDIGDNEVIIKDYEWTPLDEEEESETESESEGGINYPTGYNTIVFQDEFEGNKLDTNSWGFDIGGWGWGNDEAQYYTNQNHRVSDGLLTIRAKKEVAGDNQYTSSRLVTRDKVHFTYGYIEARIALPLGTGFWPAFWMMPNDSVYGVWPRSGEIDIMENKGRMYYITSSALHYTAPYSEDHTCSSSEISLTSSIDNFHTYGVDWKKDSISFYVDGKLNYSADKYSWQTGTAPGSDIAPFDKDFYIILNLAIGGQFDDYILPDDNLMPAEMKIDYVRWFK